MVSKNNLLCIVPELISKPRHRNWPRMKKLWNVTQPYCWHTILHLFDPVAIIIDSEGLLQVQAVDVAWDSLQHPLISPAEERHVASIRDFSVRKYHLHRLLWAWRPTSEQSEDHKLYLWYWVVLWANSCPDWLDFDDSYEALDRFYCLLLHCGSLSTSFVWSQILTERASCMLAFQKKLYRGKKTTHFS